MQTSVDASGRYGVVEEYTGHDIGSAMHMDPPVPNYGRPGRGPRLGGHGAGHRANKIMLGGPETVLLEDGWTVVTADGSWAAHFEHTVAITPDGPWVLILLAGGDESPKTPGSWGEPFPPDPPCSVSRGERSPQDPPCSWGDPSPQTPLGGAKAPRLLPQTPLGGNPSSQTPLGGHSPRTPLGGPRPPGPAGGRA